MGADGEVMIGARRAFGILNGPRDARGIVVFAHGSGSSRLSPRSAFAAACLHESGFLTLLFDLLSGAEAADSGHLFDRALLGQRVWEAIDWLDGQPAAQPLPLGQFGASTRAAKSRARCRLARREARLGRRGAGASSSADVVVRWRMDFEVLALNRRAMEALRCVTTLSVVLGAGHLFEEEGTLEEALAAACDGFRIHLGDAHD